MFADDAIHLVLWLVKGLCLIDYNFIITPKKMLVIGMTMAPANGCGNPVQKKVKKSSAYIR